MLLSRRPAPSPTLSTLIAVAALSVALAGCQSAAGNATQSRAQRQPAAPILSSDSAAFIGLGDRELSNALGKPKQVRKDAPAEIWQYGGADCVVDFYLYDSGGQMEVAFVEARDALAESASTERCVKSLLQSVSAADAPELP